MPLFRHSAVVMNGIMLIFGGNGHNETSKLRQNDCYSNQLLAFDTGNGLEVIRNVSIVFRLSRVAEDFVARSVEVDEPLWTRCSVQRREYVCGGRF